MKSFEFVASTPHGVGRDPHRVGDDPYPARPQFPRLASQPHPALPLGQMRLDRVEATHQRLHDRGHTNGKADYWTYIQEAIWSMSSDNEDQQSYLKSSSLVSP